MVQHESSSALDKQPRPILERTKATTVVKEVREDVAVRRHDTFSSVHHLFQRMVKQLDRLLADLEKEHHPLTDIVDIAWEYHQVLELAQSEVMLSERPSVASTLLQHPDLYGLPEWQGDPPLGWDEHIKAIVQYLAKEYRSHINPFCIQGCLKAKNPLQELEDIRRDAHYFSEAVLLHDSMFSCLKEHLPEEEPCLQRQDIDLSNEDNDQLRAFLNRFKVPDATVAHPDILYEKLQYYFYQQARVEQVHNRFA